LKPTRTAPRQGRLLGQEVAITISQRRSRKLAGFEVVTMQREEGRQEVAFNSRPFVLCGLPIRRPPRQVLEYTRQNGKFFLNITGHPRFGLPFGQDRLIPIWVATMALRQGNRTIRFDTASQILETFDLPRDGKTYRRLVEGFKRVFAATVFFGTEEQREKAALVDWSRFHFFDRMQVWFTRAVEQPRLPAEDFQNLVVLSEQFWKEIQQHPIPVDLSVVRALADSPGNLDFYMWLAWRCWTASEPQERIPLFGDTGLAGQLGTPEYTRDRRFRQRITHWVGIVHALWPGCPAVLAPDKEHLLIRPSRAIQGKENPQGPVED
jgi:hypothetical protein